jgi:PemK-like, MazF-like toxin of type II toxin-antitoxin system
VAVSEYAKADLKSRSREARRGMGGIGRGELYGKASTSGHTDAPLPRMLIEPTDRNGLRSASRLMIDKITTVPKARLGKRIGKLNDDRGGKAATQGFQVGYQDDN